MSAEHFTERVQQAEARLATWRTDYPTMMESVDLVIAARVTEARTAGFLEAELTYAKPLMDMLIEAWDSGNRHAPNSPQDNPHRKSWDAE